MNLQKNSKDILHDNCNVVKKKVESCGKICKSQEEQPLELTGKKYCNLLAKNSVHLTNKRPVGQTKQNQYFVDRKRGYLWRVGKLAVYR